MKIKIKNHLEVSFQIKVRALASFDFEFHTISNFECGIANESMVLVRGSCHLDRSSIVEIGDE